MAVVIETADLSKTLTYPKGRLIYRALGNGEVAVSLAPNGRWEDPEEGELARGVPRVFVNQWGVRVRRVGNISFWEEVEDMPDVDVDGFCPIHQPDRVTIRVTVH